MERGRLVRQRRTTAAQPFLMRRARIYVEAKARRSTRRERISCAPFLFLLPLFFIQRAPFYLAKGSKATRSKIETSAKSRAATLCPTIVQDVGARRHKPCRSWTRLRGVRMGRKTALFLESTPLPSGNTHRTSPSTADHIHVRPSEMTRAESGENATCRTFDDTFPGAHIPPRFCRPSRLHRLDVRYRRKHQSQ